MDSVKCDSRVGIVLLVLVSVALVGILFGCGGGRRSFDIDTGANGTLAGVRTIPKDGDYNVPVHIWIRIYWPSGTEPPAVFTFTLRDENNRRVKTIRHDGEQRYDWWFEPVYYLDYNSRYKIELESSDERVMAYFWTEGEGRAPVASPGQPQRNDGAVPMEEHTVYTR